MLLLFLACSKNEEPEEESIDEFAYEVECKTVRYHQSNSTKTVKNNQGKWSYGFDQKVTFEFKLSVKTAMSTQQTRQVYVLKKKEVVFGNIGYKIEPGFYWPFCC